MNISRSQYIWRATGTRIFLLFRKVRLNMKLSMMMDMKPREVKHDTKMPVLIHIGKCIAMNISAFSRI